VAPFEVSEVQASRNDSISSHALSPQALLQVLRQLGHEQAPACLMLAIRGEQFELGAQPSPAALANLDAAMDWLRTWLDAS
jgi:hypothetical protein